MQFIFFLNLKSLVGVILLAVMISAPNSNPTNREISPRRDQTPEQQQADQNTCFEQTCESLQWDPYEAYDELVDQGYAVVLDSEELERGLICLATRGAVVGAVVGEGLGGQQDGAAVGAAVGIASGLIQTDYLLEPDDPQSRRIVERFERDLRKWETKFTSCMKRKGYRVQSD